MDSNFSGVSSQIKGLSTGQAYGPQAPVSKNLTQPGAGAAANPELASWYEQAYAYYNAVMAGDPNTPKPDAQSWNNFMAQMQWASQQLGYGGAQAWDPSMGGGYGPQGPMGPMGQQGPQSNQFGGMSGTMDNWVYTDENNTVGFTGDGTHDLWGNNVVINVAPTSASVTVENTTDTRFQPNEPVVKITVTDPATGTQAVYFVHDYDPANGDKIKINTPNSTQQVTNNTGDTTSITTGKFTPGGAAGAGTKPDASIEGVVQEDGTILYEPEFAGGTIDFWANPGESQTHVVYSDANISTKPSDNVNITIDAATGDLIVTVTHTTGEHAGTTDTYKIKKGYNLANINVNAEYITFNGNPMVDGEIPADFQERVQGINGATNATGEAAEGAADAQSIIDSLQTNLSGNKDNQLLNALYEAGYRKTDGTRIETIEEFKDLIPDKFPGAPDNKLINLLIMLDPQGLGKAVSDVAATHDPEDDAKLNKAVTESLMALLGPLYPNDIVTIGTGNDYSFKITGTTYEWGVDGSGNATLSEA
ncbi:hypothetical protein FBR05_11430 [Deltaproteobacteria bacterium PRO3]|nr:hypothetical protein [Deltaproteobacteria bacterium PRO3]